MAEVDQLFPEVRAEVRGCPNPMLRLALLRAAREFCQATRYVRRQLQFSTVTNQSQYPLTFAATTGLNPSEEVIGLRHAQIIGLSGSAQPLWFPYGTQVNPNWQPSQPVWIIYIPEGVVQLSPAPDQVYVVQPEAVTQPCLGSAWVPDELINKFDRALGFGALAWLHGQGGNQPGEQNPYYNEAKAEKNRRLFDVEVARGRRLAQNDSTPSPRDWVRRAYAGGWRGQR